MKPEPFSFNELHSLLLSDTLDWLKGAKGLEKSSMYLICLNDSVRLRVISRKMFYTLLMAFSFDPIPI